MKNRFLDAWDVCKSEYEKGRIPTERTLQAVLFCRLAGNGEEIVVCEPLLVIEGRGKYCPDLIAIRRSEVIAVCEIKFLPHHFPVYENDLDKIEAYAASTSSYSLLIDPASGKFTDTKYRVSKDCLYVFAVMGRHDSEAVCADKVKNRMAHFGDDFLHLSYSPRQ